MKRRVFLQSIPAIAAFAAVSAQAKAPGPATDPAAGEVMTVRGRIRAAVHDWLAASRHREKIAAVRGAHRRHGGGGSLYVILRR